MLVFDCSTDAGFSHVAQSAATGLVPRWIEEAKASGLPQLRRFAEGPIVTTMRCVRRSRSPQFTASGERVEKLALETILILHLQLLAQESTPILRRLTLQR